MKTIFRNLTGLIIAVLLLAPGERAWSQSDKGFFTISGTVKERGSQKRLEYSVVALKGSNVGTIANANGEFSLKIKEGTDSKAIIFSHLGYSNFELPIDGSSKKKLNKCYGTPFCKLRRSPTGILIMLSTMMPL